MIPVTSLKKLKHISYHKRKNRLPLNCHGKNKKENILSFINMYEQRKTILLIIEHM